MRSIIEHDRPGRLHHSQWIMPGLISIVSICALLFHARYYLPFISDDALISLRYSGRFIEGHGLTWTDGVPVEGYSNLLWVLACALLGYTGLDLILASRILGISGMIAAILAVVYAYRPRMPRDALPALGGALALALAGPVAIWSIGGLEQSFIAGLLAWTIVLCYPLVNGGEGGTNRTIVPGLLAGLLILSRPDSPLLVAAICLGLVVAGGWSRKSITTGLYVIALPIIFWLAQETFRLVYYGDWLPNTARVKVGFTASRLHSGWHYLVAGSWSVFVLFIPASVAFSGVRNDHAARGRLYLLLIPFLIWSAYTAVIGGDIFPGHRLLVPNIVLLALMISEALTRILRWGETSRTRAWLMTGIVLICFFTLQMTDPQNRRALKERWEWDGEVIGKLLGRAFGDRKALLAVDPSGCLPYFSGLPALDMLGLSDRTIARTPPADFGQGLIGHELGNGRYVLDRKPDLVVFNGPMGHWNPRAPPEFRSAREMMQDSRFGEFYQLVTFEGTDPHRYFSRIWVRKEDGKIGIERKPGLVRVPGFLLSSNPRSIARLDEAGRIGTTAEATVPARITRLHLPCGKWQLSIEASGGDVRAAIGFRVPDKAVVTGGSGLYFDIDDADPPFIDVEITPVESRTVHLRNLRFEKIAD